MRSHPSSPDFGQLFKLSRKYLGLNQDQMAELLDTTQSRVSKLERRDLEPMADELWVLINRVTDVDLLEEFALALADVWGKLNEESNSESSSGEG